MQSGRSIFRSTCVSSWVKLEMKNCPETNDVNDKTKIELTLEDYSDRIDLVNTAQKVQVKKGPIKEKEYAKS